MSFTVRGIYTDPVTGRDREADLTRFAPEERERLRCGPLDGDVDVGTDVLFDERGGRSFAATREVARNLGDDARARRRPP